MLVEEKYPPGTVIEGVVRNLTNFGAFVEIEEGIDGLLHVSDMSWTKKVSHPSEMANKGDTVRAVVLSVDQEKKKIALGMKQLEEDPWHDEIPSRYQVGTRVTGSVTKLTNFGVFVELEPGLEGLLHISELTDRKIADPEEIVAVGEKIEIRVLRVDSIERKIGLAFVGKLSEEGEAEAPAEEPEAEAETSEAEEPAAEEPEAEVEAPEAEEPVAEEPEAEEPVAEEPEAAEEPVAEEPAAEPEAETEEPEAEAEAPDAEPEAEAGESEEPKTASDDA
jgi:small subunit ribosomal protein S1